MFSARLVNVDGRRVATGRDFDSLGVLTKPDEVLVLPAHNDPFHGLHARLDHLIAGHERSLGRLEKALADEWQVQVDLRASVDKSDTITDDEITLTVLN